VAATSRRGLRKAEREWFYRATWQKLVAGQTADDVYPEAVADADRAFALLATGTCDARS
jgi:hypothetical protein